MSDECFIKIHTYYKNAQINVHVGEAEKEIRNRLVAEQEAIVKANNALTGEEKCVRELRLEIINTAMLISRPCCGKAFYDFDGCAAVQCKCGPITCNFCGLCLTACTDSPKTHRHVTGVCR